MFKSDKMGKKENVIKMVHFVLLGLFLSINVQAQKIDFKEALKINSIPFFLKTVNDPLKVEVIEDAGIKITSKGKTNLFNSPGNNYYVQNAPMLLFHPDSNFIISAKITADLKEVYDVAALVIYQDNDLWAKLCFENSINKETTVVSVVTRRYSDDCNSIKILDKFVYLTMAKKGNEISFHYSTDNVHWELVRHFRLECSESDLMIGFAVHCSVGEKFAAEFSEINYTNNILENMRIYK